MTKFTFSEPWIQKAIELEGDANVGAGAPETDDGHRPCYRVGAIIIPGCWGTVHSGDMRDCYCERPSKEDRLAKLEKQVAELLKRLPANRDHTPDQGE